MNERKPTVFDELGSLLHHGDARDAKNTWNHHDDTIAQWTFAKLRSIHSRLAALPEDVKPERLGRGWHNMAYKVGDLVIKIPHSEGPVQGMSYPQDDVGAINANDHVHALRDAAQQKGLSHLIDRNEGVFFVRGNGSDIPDGVVSVQKLYKDLIGPSELDKYELTQEDRIRLAQEIYTFFRMFLNLRNIRGLRIDTWGKANLAITKIDEDGKYHFVLGDTQPADHKIAGVVTELGLDAALIKTIGEWSLALSVPGILGRLVRQRAA